MFLGYLHFLDNQKEARTGIARATPVLASLALHFYFHNDLLDQCRSVYRQTRLVVILWREHRELSRMQHEMIAFRIEEVDIIFRRSSVFTTPSSAFQPIFSLPSTMYWMSVYV